MPQMPFAYSLHDFSHEIRPRLHHAAPLFEIRRAPVGGTNLIWIGVRECRLAHLVTDAGLGGPGLE